MKQPTHNAAHARPPIQLTGILFALVANLLFVYLADRLVRLINAPASFELAATLIAPLLVGVATAFYVRARGGIHALIGGMLSIPVLALLVFGGTWQFALLAGAFCALGGALTERVLRGRAVD
jgi:hypothetical protein